MLLTFSKDRFVDDIRNGTKIHTIRTDKANRWKPGNKIHFWRGNPRNIKNNPYSFGDNTCKSVQEIVIHRVPDSMTEFEHGVMVLIGDRWLQDWEIQQLAKNDGLSPREFRVWFVPLGQEKFTGKIIHWTDIKY